MENRKVQVRLSLCDSIDKNAWNWFVTSNRPNSVCSTLANEFSWFFSALNAKYVNYRFLSKSRLSKLWINSDCWTQKEPLTKMKFNRTYRKSRKTFEILLLPSLQIASRFNCFLVLIFTLQVDTRRPNTMVAIILTAQFVHRGVRGYCCVARVLFSDETLMN